MALTLDMQYKGIAVPGAYVYVSSVTIPHNNTTMAYGLRFAATPEAEAFDATGGECPYSIDGGNPIEQVYTYLKTLPEFDGATDC